jgi:hypothetical protein
LPETNEVGVVVLEMVVDVDVCDGLEVTDDEIGDDDSFSKARGCF